MSMPDLNRIYDEKFFAEWGRDNLDYVTSARMISEVLFENFQPGRLVDLGCGCGVYGHFFAQRGVEVVSIDGVVAPERYSFGVKVQVRDLTVEFENEWGDFDLALCLDVGEHIPESLSGVFLKNITRFSDTLLLACAQPNEGGTHHVNEQPKRYWILRLAEHGFDYDRRHTGVLLETFKRNLPPLGWMWEHISVYRRRLPG